MRSKGEFNLEKFLKYVQVWSYLQKRPEVIWNKKGDRKKLNIAYYIFNLMQIMFFRHLTIILI